MVKSRGGATAAHLGGASSSGAAAVQDPPLLDLTVHSLSVLQGKINKVRRCTCRYHTQNMGLWLGSGGAVKQQQCVVARNHGTVPSFLGQPTLTLKRLPWWCGIIWEYRWVWTSCGRNCGAKERKKQVRACDATCRNLDCLVHPATISRGRWSDPLLTR